MSSTPTSTVVIVGVIEVRPDRNTEFAAVMATLAAATNQEPGCIAFRYAPLLDHPTAYLVAEQYRNREAFDTHGARPHTHAYAAALPDLLAEPVTFTIYSAVAEDALVVTPAP